MDARIFFMAALLCTPSLALTQTPEARHPHSTPSQSVALPVSPPAASASLGADPTPYAAQAPAPLPADELLQQVIVRQSQQNDLINHQHEILKDQIKALRPNSLDKWLPAIFGLLGTLIGTLVGAVSAFRLQRQRLHFDRAMARQTAGIKEMSEIKQFRSRQLNEFYAPLEALLLQGLVVRDELYQRLLASRKAGVAFSKRQEQGRDRPSLYVQHAGAESRPFKLIDEMPFLKKSFPDLMSIVGETVRINQLIVELIHDKVGLVLHESTELSKQLGIFLAHQSVLEDVYDSVTSSAATRLPAAGYTTSFPRDLQRLVQKDCNKLRQELRKWQKVVSQWMDRLAELGEPAR